MRKLLYSLLVSLFVTTASYTQTISLIDSLNWTDNLNYCHACQLGSSEFYAVTYTGASTSIYLAVAELDETDGSWVQNTDEVLVGTYGALNSSIIQLGTSLYYAVFYCDGSDYGTVKTYQLNESTGAITALVDSMRWCVTNVAAHPTPLRVAGDVYLVTYTWGTETAQGNPSGQCWVMTVTLDDADGSCDGVIDSLGVYTGGTSVRYPDTIYMGGDWYLTAYDDDGILASYQVTSGGAIDAAVTDTEDYSRDASSHIRPELENLGTNYFALCYTCNTNPQDIDIKSGSVNTGTGDISVPIDVLEVTSSGDQPHMSWIDEKWMAIAYRIDDGSNDGQVSTVDISATGVIAAAVEDDMEYDQTYAQLPFVLPLSDLPAFSIWYMGSVGEVKSFGITGTDNLFQGAEQYFAVINQGGVTNEGTLFTFSCQTTGIISDAVIDSYQFEADIETGVVENVGMCQISSTEYYVLVWVDDDADGMLGTIQITNEGDIADGGLTDSYEMDATAVGYPHILQVGTSNYFLVTYAQSDASTWFKTYTISDEGDITIHAVDSLNVTTIDWLGYTIPVGGNRYICYGTGGGSDGFYVTFYVNPANGAISDTPEAAAEWHPWNWYGSGRGCRIPDTKYHTTVSRGQINQYYVQEVDTTDGSVDSTPSTAPAAHLDDWQVIKPLSVGSDSVYVMVYTEATTDDGWLRTFVIHPADGTTPNFHAALDSVEFEIGIGEHFDILETSTTGLIVVTSGGTDTDGFVRSFIIAGNGTITGPLDVLEYDTDYSVGSRIVELLAADAGWSHYYNGIPPASVNGVLRVNIKNVNGVE